MSASVRSCVRVRVCVLLCVKTPSVSLFPFPRCETAQSGRGRCIVVEQEAAVADARFVFTSIERRRGKEGGRHRQTETDGCKETQREKRKRESQADSLNIYITYTGTEIRGARERYRHT